MSIETEAIIELKNIQKSYSKNLVLNIEDIKIYPGKITAIIGGTGSGKTTLLNILGLIDEPDFGISGSEKPKITINFKNTEYRIEYNEKFKWLLKETSTKKVIDFSEFRRENFSFIFQDKYLPKNFNLNQVIEVSRRIKNINKLKENKNIIADFKTKYNLSVTEEEYPIKMSGGEAQRVAIAMAVAKEPKIIIADEPTSNLDNDTAEKILSDFKNWLSYEPENKAVIWVSHHLQQVIKYADYVYYVIKGEINNKPIYIEHKIRDLLLEKKIIETYDLKNFFNFENRGKDK